MRRTSSVQSKFQIKLNHIVQKRTILLVLVSAIVFVFGQIAVVWVSSSHASEANLLDLKNSLQMIDEQSRSFLNSASANAVFLKAIIGNDNTIFEDVKHEMWRFSERVRITNDVILTDTTGNVLYSSFGDSMLTSYLVNFNNAICYNAKNKNPNEIYRAVYFDSGYYSDTLYVKPILKEAKIVGYASIFVSGRAWNIRLAESNYNGVITDMRANAMYVSKPGLVNGVNKYTGPKSGLWRNGDAQYYVASLECPSLGANIYSLVYISFGSAVWIVFIVLIGMGFAWYSIARWMNRTMAENNARSISQLMNEIRIIDKGDLQHRIQLDTADEFAEVGSRINDMVESILKLNERNTELVSMNSRIEMEQLTAQMNPHFLYNTLEIIRNLVVLDASKSEKIIMDLTRILRYCVDSAKKEVTLEEDMRYLDYYLGIQKCRFGERFSCNIAMSDECKSFLVPKLLLQPLVENSIKYGFEKKMDLHIEITGVVENNMLKINVEDDGQGMNTEAADLLKSQLLNHEDSKHSIGLRNLSRRLHLQYGDKSGLQIRNTEGVGFEVLVSIHRQTNMNP